MMSENTQTWPSFAEGLYDRLTARNAEISYAFSDMSVKVPSRTGSQAQHAKWVLNGTLKITTRDRADAPN